MDQRHGMTRVMLDQVHQQGAETPDLRNEAGHAWKQEAAPYRQLSEVPCEKVPVARASAAVT
jgi:hypothetical protein